MAVKKFRTNRKLKIKCECRAILPIRAEFVLEYHINNDDPTNPQDGLICMFRGPQYVECEKCGKVYQDNGINGLDNTKQPEEKGFFGRERRRKAVDALLDYVKEERGRYYSPIRLARVEPRKARITM